MNAQKPPRRILRSTGAILAGILVGAALSLGVDEVLHILHVYPPWSAPMHEPWLNLLALSYRIVFNIAGCYVIAKLAPHAPMRHAMIGGFIGFALSLLGAVAASDMNLGPMWYPVLLAITALPCAWIGGALYIARNRDAFLMTS